MKFAQEGHNAMIGFILLDVALTLLCAAGRKSGVPHFPKLSHCLTTGALFRSPESSFHDARPPHWEGV